MNDTHGLLYAALLWGSRFPRIQGYVQRNVFVTLM